MRAVIVELDQITCTKLQDALRLCSQAAETQEAGAGAAGCASLTQPFDLLVMDTRNLSLPAADVLRCTLQSAASCAQPQAQVTPGPQPVSAASGPALPRIAIRSKGHIHFMAPSDILTVRAEGNYVTIQGKHDTCTMREPISSVAEMLRPFGLIRVHRSVLVNAIHVTSMQPLVNGEYLLKLRNGAEVNATRTFRRNLSALASVWLGQDQDSLICSQDAA